MSYGSLSSIPHEGPNTQNLCSRCHYDPTGPGPNCQTCGRGYEERPCQHCHAENQVLLTRETFICRICGATTPEKAKRFFVWLRRLGIVVRVLIAIEVTAIAVVAGLWLYRFESSTLTQDVPQANTALRTPVLTQRAACAILTAVSSESASPSPVALDRLQQAASATQGTTVHAVLTGQQILMYQFLYQGLRPSNYQNAAAGWSKLGSTLCATTSP